MEGFALPPMGPPSHQDTSRFPGPSYITPIYFSLPGNILYCWEITNLLDRFYPLSLPFRFIYIHTLQYKPAECQIMVALSLVAHG